MRTLLMFFAAMLALQLGRFEAPLFG